MKNSAFSNRRARASDTAAGAPEQASSSALLGDFIGAVLPGNAAALERAVEMLTRHPQIDYARLTVAPADGGSGGLVFEGESHRVVRAAAYREHGGRCPRQRALPVGDIRL